MQIHELKLTIAHPGPTTQDLHSSEFEDAILEAVKGYIFENCSVQVDLVRSYCTGDDTTTTEKVGFPGAQKRGKR
jgi:hypothetical protein